MKIEKIAQEILSVYRLDTYKDKKDFFKCPISIHYPETSLGVSSVPRVVLNLSDVTHELEKKFKTNKGKTEISEGIENTIVFDLEG